MPTSTRTIAQTFTITEIGLHMRVFAITLDMTKLQNYPYTLNIPYHTMRAPPTYAYIHENNSSNVHYHRNRVTYEGICNNPGYDQITKIPIYLALNILYRTMGASQHPRKKKKKKKKQKNLKMLKAHCRRE